MKNNRYVRVKLRKEKDKKILNLPTPVTKPTSVSTSSDESYRDNGFGSAIGARPYQRSHWTNFDKFEKEERERRDQEKKRE